MRTRTSQSGCVASSTKVVSEKLNSRASACMVASSRRSASRTTASWLPASGLSVKTSTRRKENFFTRRDNDRPGRKAPARRRPLSSAKDATHPDQLRPLLSRDRFHGFVQRRYDGAPAARLHEAQRRLHFGAHRPFGEVARGLEPAQDGWGHTLQQALSGLGVVDDRAGGTGQDDQRVGLQAPGEEGCRQVLVDHGYDAEVAAVLSGLDRDPAAAGGDDDSAGREQM